VNPPNAAIEVPVTMNERDGKQIGKRKEKKEEKKRKKGKRTPGRNMKGKIKERKKQTPLCSRSKLPPPRTPQS